MKLWSGRFKEETSQLLENFNQSISFDYKLYKQDIEGSIAHGKMLNKIGILTDDDLKKVVKGLREIQGEIEANEVELTIKNEDIHMNIESLLVAKIGDLGKKLHTGRSRNDQVAVDVKMYTREELISIMDLLKGLLDTLLNLSQENIDTIMPGYTHLQRAQPVRLGFHLMAYFQMFKRDYRRFENILESLEEMPLGSGAMSGVNYETDREYMKELLGFKSISENAMDAVSDRDFLVEFQSASSIMMMHLSRFCEELILWSSLEFRFIEISDKFTTGSSIMPQKKNPDAAELIRGKTGRVYGNLMGILTVMKGLPLAYNKDMQEDKEGLFDTVDTVKISLEVFDMMLKETKFLKDNMEKAVKEGFLNATDLADYLVKKGLHFRDCHEIVGRIISYCIDKNIPIEDMSLEELKGFNPLFEDDVYTCIDMINVVEGKKSLGSTNRKSVERSIKNGREFLKNKI